MTYLKQAFTNLWSAKLRSFLAMLGILVGTAAVVALLSSGRLATEKALAQFKTLGINLLSVSLFQKPSTPSESGQNDMPLSFWRTLPDQFSFINTIAPYGTSYQSMQFQGTAFHGSVIGADESLAQTIQIEMDKGHFVSFVDSFEHYCVIGHTLAKRLEQTHLTPLLGKQIQVGQTLFTIIGIASPWKDNGFFNEDINQAVIIPIAAIPLISKNSAIHHAILLLNENSAIDEVILILQRTFEQQASHLNVFIRSAKQIIAGMESQGRIFTLLLAIIGGISLLVGGIGIMNVMLVAVQERKMEIGIRKAVGARHVDIQRLFLIESILLSLSGGLLGILLGIGLTWVIACFNDWPISFYFSPLIAGFIVSTAAGTFFGFYPASRAARLEPIETLRSGT